MTVVTVPIFVSGTPTSPNGQQVGLKIQLASDASGAYVPVIALDSDVDISIGSVSQEGTWTVTANAGTNLNTSALALETGGNLATIAGTIAGGKVKVDPSGVTSPVSLASQPLPTNAAQETGGNLATLAGAVSAAKVQITVATALPAGMNTIGGTYAVPTSSSSFAITPGSSAALEASHVLKASAGNLYSVYVVTGATAGFLMTFNATSAPADGAVTPVECIPVPANSVVSISFSGAPPDFYSTGIVAVFSTTGPFTKTSSATAFFKWRVQ